MIGDIIGDRVNPPHPNSDFSIKIETGNVFNSPTALKVMLYVG